MVSELISGLLGGSSGQANGKDKRRDKLEQTKLREKELKEQRKMDLQQSKAQKAQKAKQTQRTFKEERLLHRDTKQARVDRRRAQKSSRTEGITCEHGIWKCKICFPDQYHGGV